MNLYRKIFKRIKPKDWMAAKDLERKLKGKFKKPMRLITEELIGVFLKERRNIEK